MAKNFTNTWGKGGKYWAPKWEGGHSSETTTSANYIGGSPQKAMPEQVKERILLENIGYHLFWFPAQKKGCPNLIISGDYNICHKPIDIHNPVANKNTSEFLPEEREWVSKFIDSGFIDSFREFNQEPHQYSWWSYRANAREKNLGWRIDYNMASKSLRSRLKSSKILPQANHSDHCPVVLEME